MAYIRHRDRMVQQSVLEDLRNTLIACRWMPGTTSVPVRDPDTPRVFNPVTGQTELAPKVTITTAPDQILPLLDRQQVHLIDYFPEAEVDDRSGRRRAAKTPTNTLAVDSGQASDPVDAEMGSPRLEQEYVFNLAFYGASDAVAVALMNDLRDRYSGRIVASDGVDLYDWVQDPDNPAVRMDVESFRYARSEDQSVAPFEVHLYFAELTLLDYVEP